MGNTSPWAATNRRASLYTIDSSTKLQAPSIKRQACDKLSRVIMSQAARNKLRQIVTCDNYFLDVIFLQQVASSKQQVCKSAHPLERCIFLLNQKSFSCKVLYITNRRRKYESRCRKSKTSKRLHLESLGGSQKHEREEKNSSYLWSRNASDGTGDDSKRNDQKGGERWTIEACSSLENKSGKLPWITIRRSELSGPLRLSLCWSAAGITPPWRRWTKRSSGKLLSTSPNFTARTPQSAEKNLDSNLETGSPPQGGGATFCRASLCHKQQASSAKRQAASCDILSRVTMTQDASDKHQAPSSKHQASSRKRQAAGYLFPHKVSSD